MGGTKYTRVTKQSDRHRDEHTTCLYYTEGWKVKVNYTFRLEVAN